jgi:hypothetical protein
MASSGVAPGYITADCHLGSAQQGPIVLDSSGDLVWFRALSPGKSAKLRAFNVRVQQYRGEPVLCWFQGEVVDGHGRGHYLMVDSAYRTVAEVKAAGGYMGDLHEFFVTGEGTAFFTCYGTATADLSAFGGSTEGRYFYGVAQEVDIATGKLIFQWRTDRHVGFDESYKPLTSDKVWDYFHINSISIDPSDGNLIISGRNTWTCYKIDRSNGEIIWRMGGKKGDFSLGQGVHFAFQHDVMAHAGSVLTIFDNEGGPPNESSSSRGLILHLDEAARQVSLVRALQHAPPVLSEVLGSVQPVGQGHTFVGWGTSGYFSEYGSDGSPLFDAYFERPTQCYRAFKQPWEGRPTDPPAVHALSRSGSTEVFVSWNGATEVQSWRVLTGPNAGALSAAGFGFRKGFETRLDVDGSHHYVAVEALDSSGTVIGRSRPTAVTAT